jgi:hypothetical protein
MKKYSVLNLTPYLEDVWGNGDIAPRVPKPGLPPVGLRINIFLCINKLRHKTPDDLIAIYLTFFL